jgi:hypothetical protein
MNYTMDDLHRMDPAAIISYEGHRPMQVNEVIQHLCRGDWPDQPEHRSMTQQEVVAAQKPTQAPSTEPSI